MHYGSIIKEETIGESHYTYYDDGTYSIYTKNSDGYDVSLSYDSDSRLREEKIYYSDEHNVITTYGDNNLKSTVVDYDGDEIVTTNYDYDSNNSLVKEETYRDFGDTNGDGISEDKLISFKEYDNGKIIKAEKYDFDTNGNVKTHIKVKQDGDLTNVISITKTSDGKSQTTNDYYKDGKLVARFNTPSTLNAKYNKETNSYDIYYGKRKYCTIDSNGNKTYISYDSKGNESYRIVTDEKGNYSIFVEDANGKLVKRSSGKYITKNGYIICTEGKNTYVYDSLGKLVQSEVDGVKYNVGKNSQAITKNNKTIYSMRNHIEYDDEAYDVIMKKLISIYEEAPELIRKDSIATDEIIDSFADRYDSNTSNINKSIQGDITSIEELKESINYSLLAYSTCDEELENALRDLIDNLFEDEEAPLADAFKHDIKHTIEDNDGDKILEYKASTNFKDLYLSVLPVDKYVDQDGNIWHYNLKGNLLNVTGNNPKINFGNEEFTIRIDKNGVVKLLDSSGKPINIFGDYNNDSMQYGSDQMNFNNPNKLLDDPYIKKIMDKYYDNATTEEKKKLLQSICDGGCGYAAFTNAIFKKFEGKEDEFYKTFGIPMYTVNKSGSGNAVKYNYNPIMLEVYNKGNTIARNINFSTKCGSTPVDWNNIYTKLNDEYNIFDEDYDTYIKKTGLFYDYGYKLYRPNGELYVSNGEDHAMFKTGETDDGKWIVSTWGEKFICEPCDPQSGTLY